MSLRRHSDPVALQRVWKAIEVVRGQRQIANISRITKVIQREHSYSPKDILHHILRAVKDNMVVETVSVGCKGSKAGMEQEGYWIPEDSKILSCEESHDWYCFACHKPGKFIKCNNCVRAYHKECMENLESDPKNCKYCILKKTALLETNHSRKSKDILNQCLGFIIRRAMETAPDLSQHPNPEEYTHYSYFIKQHMNLIELEKLCLANKFDVAVDFLSYLELIVHNCMLLHGENHEYTKDAKTMLEACKHEVKELSLCTNCYYLSSTKPTKEWFSTPCQPPHRVVWAKQKGFEYWPAKVIQVDNDRVDVRFFGGHHERAWVKVDCMRSIVVSPSDLQIKMTKGWTRANAEMKEYIIQTEKVFGSIYAAQIVTFDYQSSNESTQNELQSRAAKRKAEVEEACDRRYKALKLRNLKSVVDDKDAVGETNSKIIDNSPVVVLKSLKFVTDPNKLLKIFGEKAKLDSECARTWRYGTDCIASFKKESKIEKGNRKTRKNKIRKISKSSKSNYFLYKPNRCTCSKRYERILKTYRRAVCKIRKHDRKQLVVQSTILFQQTVKRYVNKQENLSLEVARLRAENEALKNKIANLQNDDHSTKQ